MTHIESTLPEIVGSEVVGLSLRDADGLAAAALYDLVRKATGCRLPQPDGTPSSEVEEMLALCSAVLRRHWQAPLTMLDGLSLQDLVSRLMADRMLEGDATLGIPAVNGSVTEALSALLERKITGAPEVADGMSLVQLLCGSAASASLTTLTDPTTGWTMDKANYLTTLLTAFPNAESISLGCSYINAVQQGIINSTLKLLDLSGVKNIVGAMTMNLTEGTIYAPNLETLTLSGYNKGWVGPIAKEIYMPRLTSITGYNRYFQGNTNIITRKWVLGTLTSLGWSQWGWTGSESAPDLIHFEICADGGRLNMSLNLNFWTATTALSSNLLQFLSNFREFLFLRLADRTGLSALTLTLSQAVYQAITGTDTTTTALTLTLNQLGITDLTEKEVEAGITLNTTYATWLETYRDAINWNIGYV